MPFLNIEKKEDSEEKLKVLIGLPSKNYLKATELNKITDAINNLDERVSQVSNTLLEFYVDEHMQLVMQSNQVDILNFEIKTNGQLIINI